MGGDRERIDEIYMTNNDLLIFIKTTRYSTFIKSVFEEYNNGVDIFEK